MKPVSRARRWPKIGLLSALLVTASAATQGQGGFVTFEFNFSNPGARSLAFGGAFVALADDATAAFANPAGLVQLLEPEISLEGRSWSYSTPYTRGGRLDGEPSGWGIDTVEGLTFARSKRTVDGLSFLSLVYPRKRWSLAVYRHQLATFEFSSETQGLFAIPFPPDPGVRREPDRRVSADYDFTSTGFAGAWRVSDALSLGLTLVHFDVRLTSIETLYLFDSFDRFFEPTSYLPERNLENRFFTVDEADWGLGGGFLWRIDRQWNLGGFYRQGPRVSDFRIRIFSGPVDPSQPPATLVFEVGSPIDFPDVFGLGVAFRFPNDRLTASFEWDRVEYSRIIESLTLENQAFIRDADELHLGAEYVFLQTRPVVALRAGLWLDPDHRLQTPAAGPLDRALFRAGNDELHLSLGLGLAWRPLQLDLALDLSDTVDTASLSTIYRW